MRAVLLVLLLLPTVAAQGEAWPGPEPLRVGVSANTAPATVLLPDGSFGGWGVDMMTLASLKTGIDIEFVPYTGLEEGVAMLQNGTVDAVGIMSTRPDLTAFASMGTPWSWTPVALISTEDHPWIDADDASGRISTIHGSPLQGIVDGRFAHMEYVQTDNPAAGMEALASGEIDAYVAPLAIAGYHIQRLQLEGLRPVGKHLSVVETGYWTTDPEAMAAVEALRAAVSPDEAQVIYVKWTGFDLSEPHEPTTRIPAWMVPAAAVIGGVLLIAVVFILLLRARVRVATREIEAKNAELQAKTLAELEGAQKMERFAADLINRTAHELSTPMTPLVLGLEGLRARLGDDHAEALDRFARNVERLRATIQTAVDASRVQAADLRAGRQDLDARAFLDDIVAKHGLRAEARGRALEASGPAAPVHVDRARLELAVGHLVDNGLKFTPTGSAVRLRTVATDSTVRIEVADEGPGIDLDQLERIWQPFAKDGEASVAGREGQGLGLYVTRQLMELEGGTVGCDSSPEGATFWIELPTAKS